MFLHNDLRHMKVNKPLSSLVVNGPIVTGKLVINDHVMNFYMDLFNEDTTSQVLEDSGLKYLILILVTSSDNDILNRLPLLEEIQGVVFSLNSHSTSGFDGFFGE